MTILDNLGKFIFYIFTYCLLSLIMLAVAIWRCGDIMEYFVACICPCIYLFYVISKSIRGCEKKNLNDEVNTNFKFDQN